MALQFRDSCDIYASASDFTKRWASATPAFLFNATGGRFGGGAITSSANTGTLVSPSGLSALTDVAIGFSFKVASKPLGATTILTMLQSTGVTMNALQVNTSGFVTCQHPSVTGNINICDGAYHWVEMRFVNATGGWLYVDGIAQGTNLAADTYGSVKDHFELNSSGAFTPFIDDIIFYDSTSGTNAMTPANGPYGPLRIKLLTATSDSEVQWTMLTGSTGGTHWSCVSEIGMDGASSYCQDATGNTNYYDLFTMTPLGYNPANVLDVGVALYCKAALNGTTMNIGAYAKNGATYLNAGGVAPPSYNFFALVQYVYPTNPNGSIAWTPANLAATTFGYKSGL